MKRFSMLILPVLMLFTMSAAFGEETKQAEVKGHEEAQATSGTIPLGI